MQVVAWMEVADFTNMTEIVCRQVRKYSLENLSKCPYEEVHIHQKYSSQCQSYFSDSHIEIGTSAEMKFKCF